MVILEFSKGVSTISLNKSICLKRPDALSQVVAQKALTRLLTEKGIFTREEFWEMVMVVDKEMVRKRI
jgi:site-specific recombinase